jgi:hypothetical protein
MKKYYIELEKIRTIQLTQERVTEYRWFAEIPAQPMTKTMVYKADHISGGPSPVCCIFCTSNGRTRAIMQAREMDIMNINFGRTVPHLQSSSGCS